MVNSIKKYTILVFLSGFLKIAEVLAAGVGETTESGTLTNPLGTTDILVVLKRISSFLILIGTPLLVIFVIIGGFQILTAAGQPEKINTGKKTILYAAIGYIVVLSAWGIIDIIKETLNP